MANEDKRREPDGPAITQTQPSMPESKPTTRMDKDEITRQLLDKVLLKLTEVGESQTKTTESVGELRGEVRELGTQLGAVSSDVHAVKIEQVEFREWKGAVEERFKTHSMGTKALAVEAKTLSVHDGNQDVKLQELENRLAIAAESSMRAILVEAKEAAKTPLGRKVVTAAGVFLLTALTAGTLYLGVVTARLQGQQQQQPTIIQVTPAPAPAVSK